MRNRKPADAVDQQDCSDQIARHAIDLVIEEVLSQRYVGILCCLDCATNGHLMHWCRNHMGAGNGIAEETSFNHQKAGR